MQAPGIDGSDAELGVAELVVFDPFPGAGRPVFTVYRRLQDRLRQVHATDEPAVVSEVLRCHIRRVGSGPHTRLRLAHGETLVPTAEEAALRRVAELEAQLRSQNRE